MNALVLTETIKFFRSYGLKCDERLVEEWLETTPDTKIFNFQVSEDDLYDFNEWCRWKGTACENGIDDKTKIARLLDEINELKCELSLLKKEKERLEGKLEIF
ncbi:hypothetical protein [Ferdinandcohnia sp. Marseille-Q9671]